MSKPTAHRGLTFESRHDAQWAAFFDACEWRWEYLPWENSEIPPTFLLWLKEPLFVIVRPWADEELLLFVAEIVSHYGGENPHGIRFPNVLLLDLAPPLNNRKMGGAKIGIIGTGETGWPRFEESVAECLGDANLARCSECQSLTIASASGIRGCLCCGASYRRGLLHPVAWPKGRELWHRAKRMLQEGA